MTYIPIAEQNRIIPTMQILPNIIAIIAIIIYSFFSSYEVMYGIKAKYIGKNHCEPTYKIRNGNTIPRSFSCPFPCS